MLTGEIAVDDQAVARWAVHEGFICVVFRLFGVPHGDTKQAAPSGGIRIGHRPQAGKVEHDPVDLPVVAVNAVLTGADTFVEMELCTSANCWSLLPRNLSIRWRAIEVSVGTQKGLMGL